MVVEGKTYFRALPSSVRLQLPTFTGEPPELYNSTKSGNVPPWFSTEVFAARISLSRTVGGGGVEPVPGVPPTWVLATQLAGSSGSPDGLRISSERLPP